MSHPLDRQTRAELELAELIGQLTADLERARRYRKLRIRAQEEADAGHHDVAAVLDRLASDHVWGASRISLAARRLAAVADDVAEDVERSRKLSDALDAANASEAASRAVH